MTKGPFCRCVNATGNPFADHKAEHRLHCQIVAVAVAALGIAISDGRPTVTASIQEQKAPIVGDAASIDALVVSGAEAAQYVERMCSELAGLADRSGLGFLAYLLEVAREEAVLHCEPQSAGSMVVHGEVPPGGQ